MFEVEKFIEDCIKNAKEGPSALKEVVSAAVSEANQLMNAFGEPEHAGLSTLFRSPELTVINFTWAPCMSLMPHNHQMYSVVGIYSGREDNILWKRNEKSIEAVGAKSLGAGDVTVLGTQAIHSVLNPIGKMTRAIHVYGGDFFNPNEARSEWDPETLKEQPWDMTKVKRLFREAEARYS